MDEDKIKEYITMLHGNMTAPKKILDVGTGNCFSAFAMEDLYPEAEIIGVDLAAPYVRFCRKWAEKRGSKVQFYQVTKSNMITRPGQRRRILASLF